MPITPASVFRSLVLLPSLAMLTACASTAGAGTDSSSISEHQSDCATGMQYVHVIVAEPDGAGWVFCSHQGIFYVSVDGEVESVGRVMDFRGRSDAGKDRLVASGHPGPDTDMPTPVGLI